MERRVALAGLLAIAVSCTATSNTPIGERDRWLDVASATGSIPAGAPATTECRWDLPCESVRTNAFEMESAPVRLICDGDATFLFVESHAGVEPWSGNAHACSDERPSAIFLVRGGEVGFYLFAVSRQDPDVPLEWAVAIQVWHGPWVQPDCVNHSTRLPRGAWEMCGEGPPGLGVPASTPDA